MTRNNWSAWSLLAVLTLGIGSLGLATGVQAESPYTTNQERSAVADGIVARWATDLSKTTSVVGAADLRAMLLQLNDDQLLVASRAGTLAGLRELLLSATEPKALNDPAADLVYNGVAPCRLFDTRASQGGTGPLVPGARRAYGVVTPVSNQGGPGGCQAPPGAAVAIIVLGTLFPSGNGILQGGSEGAAAFPNALILFQPGDQYGATVALPLNTANGQFEVVAQFASTELYGDLVGYFSAPTPPPPRFCSSFGGSVTGAVTFLSCTVNVTVPAGQNRLVTVTSNKAFGSTIAGGASGLFLYICSQISGGALVSYGSNIGGITVPQTTRMVFGLSAQFTLGPGSYAVGLCGASTSPANWNANEYSYTTAVVQ